MADNNTFNQNSITDMLNLGKIEEIQLLRANAYSTMKQHCGDKVYLRGLVEFSNICVNDCYYCGIRRSNSRPNRYTLDKDEILTAALWCAEHGYASFVLQSGDRRGDKFIKYVADITEEIKRRTRSENLPDGLGITLCVGEQPYDDYKRMFEAGAHRYLLRVETTNEKIFNTIHDQGQDLKRRIECLHSLREIGYQVGTGVMIGLPGQSSADLARDILFFKEMDIDMIGMGPFIVHNDTPMAGYAEECRRRADEIFWLAIKMIAVTRLVLQDVNIASTTALQAMRDDGREIGLMSGANVIMPLHTPLRFRKQYMLYENKPYVDEFSMGSHEDLERRIKSIGREIAYNDWGDSRHFQRKKGRP